MAADDATAGTPICSFRLLAAGYRERERPLDEFKRSFDKKLDGYWLVFEECPARVHLSDGRERYRGILCCTTGTGGRVRIEIEEPTIEATESRAMAMREAARG